MVLDVVGAVLYSDGGAFAMSRYDLGLALPIRDENSATWYRYGMEARACMYLWDLMEDETDTLEMEALWAAYNLLSDIDLKKTRELLTEIEQRARPEKPGFVAVERPEVESGFVPLSKVEGIRSSVPIEHFGEM